jgi:uncharacterized protein with GYD domain
MPMYVNLVKWTDQGAKTAKGAVSRWEQGRAAIEQAGGSLGSGGLRGPTMP